MPTKITIQIALKITLRRRSWSLLILSAFVISIYTYLVPKGIAVDIGLVLLLLSLLSVIIMDESALKKASEGLTICGATRKDILAFKLTYTSVLASICLLPISIAVYKSSIIALFILMLFYVLAIGVLIRD